MCRFVERLLNADVFCRISTCMIHIARHSDHMAGVQFQLFLCSEHVSRVLFFPMSILLEMTDLSAKVYTPHACQVQRFIMCKQFQEIEDY